MRYDERDEESKNVDDRRGQGGGGFGLPGGIQIPIGGGGGLSLTSLLIIGALMLLFGINPLDVLLGPQVRRTANAERPRRTDAACRA
jgi:uncharacterized protein